MLQEDVYSSLVERTLQDARTFELNQSVNQPRGEGVTGGGIVNAAFLQPLANRNQGEKRLRAVNTLYTGGNHVTIAKRVVHHKAIGASDGKETGQGSHDWGSGFDIVVTVEVDTDQFGHVLNNGVSVTVAPIA